MNQAEFQARTKHFALRIVRLVESLPPGPASRAIGDQILRSGMSVGANYRAACRARSTNDMIAKLKIVEEEADETLYWLELLSGAGIMPEERLAALMGEGDEILAMTVASIKTLRDKQASRTQR